jgi:hypothetical protein
LIRSAEKTAAVIIIAIAVLAGMSLLDTLEVENLTKLFPRHSLDILITTFSIIALAILGYMLYSLLKSRHTLEAWADMFEQNAIRSSLNILLGGKSKEEIVRSLSESIEQLGEPLQSYISQGPFNEYFDVQIDDNNKFEILIDSQRTISSKDQSNLKELLTEYGAIAVRIVDKSSVDERDVVSFSDTLHKYVSNSGNDIGLAILVGPKITQEAENYAKNSRDFITRRIIIIEINSSEFQHDNNQQHHHQQQQ